MAKTFHDAREARKSSRVTRAQLLSAAETLAETLETIAERREAQHSAEMAARQCTDTDGIGNDLVWVGDWE